MRSEAHTHLPRDKRAELKTAIRWEWTTLLYMSVAAVLVYLTMGSSQAMKTAFIEDLLSLVPPISFLISHKLLFRRPTRSFPYGRFRAVSLAFLIAAAALMTLGLWLVIENALKLIKAEHPTIGTTIIFGETVWMGWFMIAALVYSTAGPIVFGIKKLRLARSLHDKVLFTDGEMNKADWLSGSAAIVGIVLIGFGFWWGDALAALIIAVDILVDGYQNVKTVFADLQDRVPMTVDRKQEDPVPKRVEEALRSLAWIKELHVRMREHGMYLFGEVFIVPREHTDLPIRLAAARQLAESIDWRVGEIIVAPVASLDDYPSNSEPRLGSTRTGGRTTA